MQGFLSLAPQLEGQVMPVPFSVADQSSTSEEYEKL